jgi:hypothetical protein
LGAPTGGCTGSTATYAGDCSRTSTEDGAGRAG